MRTSEAFFLPFRSVLIVAEPDGKMLEVEPIVCKLDGKVRKLTLFSSCRQVRQRRQQVRLWEYEVCPLFELGEHGFCANW